MSDFNLVTVCNKFPTEPYFCLAEFIKSIGDTPTVVLGRQPDEYKGLGDKPKLLRKAIKEKYIKADVIIFTDCFDVVFQSSPQMTYDMFLHNPYNSDVVISSERNCFPAALKNEYDKLPCNTSFKYLNSGFIIGYTDAILECLEAMNLDEIGDDYRKEDGSMHHYNDQEFWMQLYLNAPVKIAMDTNAIFSNALHSMTMNDLDFSEPQIRNKETGTQPFHLHLNGSAKTDGLREPILQHLNLI